MLLLIGVSELLAISPWMTASAVSPQLSELWQLSVSQVAFLTTIVQIGFVLGTALAAILNLADLLPNRHYFAVCALLTAAANAVLLACDSFAAALVARFFVGFFLAGVYPPAMKMTATWFKRDRGFAIGSVVGALTVGKAIPFLLKSFGAVDWSLVVICASLASSTAAIFILLMYRDGPHKFARRQFSWSRVGEVARHRPTRLAIGGYLGHMWELYAMWTCVPLFLNYVAAKEGVSQQTASFMSFAAVALGGFGCSLGGRVADRIGRENLVNICLVVSGSCCLLVGPAASIGFWISATVALIWGMFVVADSAQFSTLVTEVTDQHNVGTALTLQTSVGFLLTIVTIQLTPVLAKQINWSIAFAVLTIGPIFGVAAMRELKRVR